MNSQNEKILNNSVQYLKSVGPKRAESFQKIGIRTIRDLLFYFPTRYLDRTTIINAAKAYGYVLNGFEGEITILGKVSDVEKLRFGKKELLKVHFKDDSGFFECVWFQGIKYFEKVFKEDEIYAISSRPEVKFNRLQFVHPDFDRITEDESRNFANTGKIIPVYKIPKELKEKNIGDLSLRRIITSAVENYSDYLTETMPEYLLKSHKLAPITEAVKNYHFPIDKESLAAARFRFKFEEMFYLGCLVALRRKKIKTDTAGNPMIIKSSLVPDFLKILPFELTSAQLKVLAEIRKDMAADKPMNRLLQGDVGSGKTVVALIAMLIAIDNGFQAALMAPTEILADQHAKNLSAFMNKLKESGDNHEIKISLLLGGQKKSLRTKNLDKIEQQESDIIVGTHALFEGAVKFKNLGLVIIDEQHRFGVKQRALLQTKGKSPDVLVMSATPIPRTLSMTVYGDLDMSVIDELPKNRKPIKTVLRGEKKLPGIYDFIVKKNAEGYQAFIVYPLVEESEKLELKAATTLFDELKGSFLKNLNLGLIHGRMSWQEKEEVMIRFLEKQFDVLISTTVIEVGIDIPDANIILINDAHRFGLSQLHQLRGRVGRSNKQAYCILVTRDEYVSRMNFTETDPEYLSSAQMDKYRTAIRLQSMVNYNDGFKIADIDLKLRGPGNIFGTEQSGFPDLIFTDIVNDHDIILEAKLAAFKVIEDDPHLIKPQNKVVNSFLTARYSDNLKFSGIA